MARSFAASYGASVSSIGLAATFCASRLIASGTGITRVMWAVPSSSMKLVSDGGGEQFAGAWANTVEARSSSNATNGGLWSKQLLLEAKAECKSAARKRKEVSSKGRGFPKLGMRALGDPHTLESD